MKTRNTFGFTLVEIMVVVTIIGLLAALALPAFQRVRASSQDKAVTGNLRQVASAAEQYFVEHGASVVASVELVGTNSTQYLKEVQLVARESYSNNITLGQAVSALGVAGTRTVTYSN